VNDIHVVKMLQSRRNLNQSLFAMQQRKELMRRLMLLGLEQIGKSGLAEIQSDIKEIVTTFLTVVSDDIRMVVTGLKEFDFLTCNAGEVAQETFDSYRSTTPCSFQDDCSMRAPAYMSVYNRIHS
jgi:transcriptional regulator of aromatic amino acid metabolism